MEMIKTAYKGQNKYDEYEALLLERDQLSKEAGQIWTAYVQTFGQLMTDVYEEKIECIKARKTIAFYQRALNHGGVVDQEALDSWLDREMSAYYANHFEASEIEALTGLKVGEDRPYLTEKQEEK